MIELAMPAGELENALTALYGGADAVYFGMKEFSARAGAGNFSFEDLGKIKYVARKNGKKIYVTLNTLIRDDEIERAFAILSELEKTGIDGLIVQDLGIARIVRNNFPSIPLHASTQMAVHTASGIRVLESIGFSRTVLSRELSFEEIKAIREECPESDIKVFVHGAMCYGFSGLCMASFVKTGRSANRGMCAQVCRTWFEDEGKRRSYPFSLKDLEYGEKIRELDKIGINSAKVEGRMKGNEYVKYVSEYYRNILDGNKSDENEHLFTFSREHSDGYFSYSGPCHGNLNTHLYTGHLGGKALEVKDVKGNLAIVEKLLQVNPRDGLMKINDEGSAEKFPARFIDGKLSIPNGVKLKAGDILYKVSDSSMNAKTPSTNIPVEKNARKALLRIEKHSLTLTSSGYEKSYDVEVEEGKSGKGRESLKKTLEESGKDERIEIAEMINVTGFEDIFIPGKVLKAIRRDYLESLPKERERKYIPDIRKTKHSVSLPPRSAISSLDVPWSLDGVVVDDRRYITLPPVIFDEDEIYKRVEENIEKSGEEVLVGLNNIAEVEWAKGKKNVHFFSDVYLYLSNRESAALLSGMLRENLVGGYLWLEEKTHGENWPFEPTPVGKDFNPPLFISRSCYRHDSLSLPCKGCSKEHEYCLFQNGKRHKILVRNCMTIVWEVSDEAE